MYTFQYQQSVHPLTESTHQYLVTHWHTNTHTIILSNSPHTGTIRFHFPCHEITLTKNTYDATIYMLWHMLLMQELDTLTHSQLKNFTVVWLQCITDITDVRLSVQAVDTHPVQCSINHRWVIIIISNNYNLSSIFVGKCELKEKQRCHVHKQFQCNRPMLIYLCNDVINVLLWCYKHRLWCHLLYAMM